MQAVKANAKVADRSLRVYFYLPLIAGWDIWAPCKFGQKAFDGMTPFEFMYTQIPYVSDQEIILPMISPFNRKLNVGYSVVEPIDENVPAAKFFFNNGEKCFNWGSMHQRPENVPVLETVNYYIGLVGKRTMKTRIHVIFHAGDWRPGLGKVYKKYQEFFDPYNDAIYDREGCFLCGTVYNSDEVDKLLAMGLKTFEVHGHFQEYSDYFSDGKDKWLRVKGTIYWKLLDEEEGRRQQRRDRPTRCRSTPTRTRPSRSPPWWADQDVNDDLALPRGHQAAAEDIRRQGHLPATGTSTTPTASARPWRSAGPTRSARDEDGKPIPSGWYMCHNMNADPRYSFGKFALRVGQEDLRDLPDAAAASSWTASATTRSTSPTTTALRWSTASPPTASTTATTTSSGRSRREIMRPRNLTSFANKPMSIRSMRYVRRPVAGRRRRHVRGEVLLGLHRLPDVLHVLRPRPSVD